MNDCCKTCGRKLTPDEMALFFKIVSRSSQDFLCLDCMAEYFRVPPDALRDKIAFFKRNGCMLFTTD